MSFARILAPLSGAPAEEAEAAAGDRDVAVTALALAETFKAQLRFLHVSIDPTRALPLLGEGMSGAMAAQLTEDLTAQAERSNDAALALFRQLCSERGLPVLGEGEKPRPGAFSVAYERVDGVEEEAVTAKAKLCDLTIVPHPGRQEGGISPTLEGVLFNSGRPLLVAPEGGFDSLPKKMAVAWNGSAESARAVALAMPLLLRAQEVVVVSGEGEDAAPEARPSALAGLLEAHGLNAATWRYQPEDWPVARSLVEETRKSGARLLVMGAYGHSRVREMLLGGATREAMKAGDLGLVMAH